MRTKTFHLIFPATLALTFAVGANLAVFIPVNAVLLRPLPYPDPSQLTLIQEISPQFREMQVAYPNFIDWREQSQVFTQLAAYAEQSFSLSGGGEPERVRGGRASASLFLLLGVTPLLGRGFIKEEEQPDSNRVVVLSESLWRRRFAADATIIGRTLTLNSATYTVVGVMPGSFSFPPRTELWAPLVNDSNLMDRRRHFLSVVGRLKHGVSITQAQAEMDAIARRLAQQYPDTNPLLGVMLRPLSQEMDGSWRPALLILLGATGFMLLLACVNAANLLLTRTFMQSPEAAGHAAKTAGRGNLLSRLAIEVLLIYAVSVIGGIALAYFGVRRLSADAQPDLARLLGGPHFDLRVLGFVLVISFVAMIISGLTPLIKADSLDHQARLRMAVEPGKSTLLWIHLFFGAIAAVIQVALALILITGAGLLFKSFLRLRATETGFRPDQVWKDRARAPNAL